MHILNKNRVKNYLIRFDEILNTMECKMLLKPNCDNITIYFINCMIPHHQAAIYMCENLLNYTEYEPLIKIANNIITTQEAGIKEMREIRCTTQGYESCQEDMKKYMAKYLEIVKNMINNMRNAPKGIDINLNFICEMIPHHEGAIRMCKNLLEYNIDPRLKEVAESIIKEQSEGIKELEKIREKLVNKTLHF